MIISGEITSGTEYTEFHKKMLGRDKDYDELYKNEDGKEFLHAEFQ
jgi:hypothetical protein